MGACHVIHFVSKATYLLTFSIKGLTAYFKMKDIKALHILHTCLPSRFVLHWSVVPGFNKKGCMTLKWHETTQISCHISYLVIWLCHFGVISCHFIQYHFRNVPYLSIISQMTNYSCRFIQCCVPLLSSKSHSETTSATLLFLPCGCCCEQLRPKAPLFSCCYF